MSPFLCTGTTNACLRQAGKVPVVTDRLKKLAKIGATTADDFLSIVTQTFSTPLALPVDNALIAVDTSRDKTDLNVNASVVLQLINDIEKLSGVASKLEELIADDVGESKEYSVG